MEIQVRTLLQHRWAEYSEKLADRLGFELKYGSGPEEARSILSDSSELIAENEKLELEVVSLAQRMARLGEHAPQDMKAQISDLQTSIANRNREIEQFLRDAVTSL